MEEQVKPYYGYLRFVALMMMLIIGNAFRTESSYLYSACMNIYTAPIIAGAFVCLFWRLSILGSKLAIFMEKRKLAIWPLVVTVMIVWFWSVIRFR